MVNSPTYPKMGSQNGFGSTTAIFLFAFFSASTAARSRSVLSDTPRLADPLGFRADLLGGLDPQVVALALQLQQSSQAPAPAPGDRPVVEAFASGERGEASGSFPSSGLTICRGKKKKKGRQLKYSAEHVANQPHTREIGGGFPVPTGIPRLPSMSIHPGIRILRETPGNAKTDPFFLVILARCLKRMDKESATQEASRKRPNSQSQEVRTDW